MIQLNLFANCKCKMNDIFRRECKRLSRRTSSPSGRGPPPLLQGDLLPFCRGTSSLHEGPPPSILYLLGGLEKQGRRVAIHREEEGVRQGRRWLQNGKKAGGGGLKTGRRRAGMAGGGGQKAGEEGRPQGRRSPRQDAVSICATLSKLFRAINPRQLRSPRGAIAGWRGALRD